MSDEQAQAIKAKLASDPAFAAKLKAATSREDAARIVAEHGLTLDDFTDSNSELSESELETIAGGTLPRPAPPFTQGDCCLTCAYSAIRY